MDQPILLEESTPFKLSSVLERLMKSLPKDANHHDHLMVSLIVLLAEAGFWPHEMTVDSTVKRWHTDFLRIPEKWKTEDGVYRINFCLPTTDKVCKLIAIPTGDVLVVTLLPPAENITTGYNMAIQTLKYFNPHSSDIAGRYMNLKELSFRFKDGLTTPLRTDLLQDEGIINPSLEGLPVEIKSHILKMLPIRTVRRIGQCNREFHNLTKTPEIQRYFRNRKSAERVSFAIGEHIHEYEHTHEVGPNEKTEKEQNKSQINGDNGSSVNLIETQKELYPQDAIL